MRFGDTSGCSSLRGSKGEALKLAACELVHKYLECSVTQLAQHSSGSANPDARICFGWACDGDNEVGRHSSGGKDTLSFSRLVERSVVQLFVILQVNLGDEPNDRHCVIKNRRLLIVDDLVFSVPARSIKEHTVDVHSLFWRLFEVSELFFGHDLEAKGKLINGDLVETGMSLQATSHETLREEEAGEPVGVGLSFFKPESEHLDTLN